VHFLMIWTGAISELKKTSIIEAILGWMPTPPEIPADVAAAMAPGLVNPGMWALWVPRISSTSCNQAIFVDHATDASVPSDTVLLKIDRFG
jgi:hypothetical protein